MFGTVRTHEGMLDVRDRGANEDAGSRRGDAALVEVRDARYVGSGDDEWIAERVTLVRER